MVHVLHADLDTTYTADSVEWCPVQQFERVLACGTYQLMESGVRTGSVVLYEWTPEEKVREVCNGCYSHGVLDSKWHNGAIGEYLTLALASSNDGVAFMKLREASNGVLSLCEVNEILLTGLGSAFCLSLDWCKDPISLHMMVSSSSNGHLHLLDAQVGLVTQSWKAHDFEAWIAAFDHTCNSVFSGGDDCQMYMWDTRCTQKPVVTIKQHEMGVCSIQVHPSMEHVLASGSYDETLRLWDKRQMLQPLKELKLGGGIWRVKWHKSHPDWLAAACMHSGFALANCNLRSGGPAEVMCTYKGHSSLAYGIDWCPLNHAAWQHCGDGYAALLSSCSFYDHSLHLWTAIL